MNNWTKKAEQALRTGQPRLAELYMRRALSETAEGRALLARRDLVAALNAIGADLNDWMNRCVDALGAAMGATGAAAGRQDSYALAGPSRGAGRG
ncbi:hypothetical protein SEA_BRYNNIE_53 [Arthrobacter phage Brynnie]|nr:hypothetical protein SEA_BRYNNIE_53 [Arthrobacter phage Brynnie]